MKLTVTNSMALSRSHLPGPQFHLQKNEHSNKICSIKLLMRLEHTIVFKVFSCAWHKTVFSMNKNSSEWSILLQHWQSAFLF